MAVLPTLKRKDKSDAEPAAEEAAAVHAARVRARRRLIGAAVLVGIGIIGFPLLFETQPRPIAVDIPIEIPPRDRAAPPTLPVPAAKPAPEPWPVITERAEPAASAQAPDVAAKPAAPPAATAASTPAKTATAAAAASRPAAAAQSEQMAEARRAQALLEGKPVPNGAPDKAADASDKAPRFVVQAGAYSDASALRDARQRVEKLGLKTYVQTVDTDAGKRTRLRVGPFASRDDAEKAAARIKDSGLAVNILSL